MTSPPAAALPNTARLLAVMARLRDPATGCPWDIEQNFASIAPYTIEEAYEVAEAIVEGDMAALEGELGDLLLQVAFHARMAEEQGLFDFESVAGAIADKLIERHPHVFADAAFADQAAQTKAWEDQKAEKRKARHPGTLDDIPYALPALMRAQKIGKRAARIGFDWSEIAGVRAKVEEELAELDETIAANDPAATEEEFGDLLFSLASLARHAGFDAEEALRRANRKFERRFRAMEALIAADGRSLAGLNPQEMERYWGRVKAEENPYPSLPPLRGVKSGADGFGGGTAPAAP